MRRVCRFRMGSEGTNCRPNKRPFCLNHHHGWHAATAGRRVRITSSTNLHTTRRRRKKHATYIAGKKVLVARRTGKEQLDLEVSRHKTKSSSSFLLVSTTKRPFLAFLESKISSHWRLKVTFVKITPFQHARNIESKRQQAKEGTTTTRANNIPLSSYSVVAFDQSFA